MVLFSQAVLALQSGSKFDKAYHAGVKKDMYWESTLEDALDLTAKLPTIAAFIYRLKYGEGKETELQSRTGLRCQFCQACWASKIRKGIRELSRLYFILHSDHESGNVSAHATHLAGSALSDAYYAFSAGLNGLAGPLHGLANQECLGWLIDVRDKFGGVPSSEDLYKFAWDTLMAARSSPVMDMLSCE